MNFDKPYNMSAISLEELKQLQAGILALANTDPTRYYILDEHNKPIEMNDGVIEWTRWHDAHKEQVWVGQETFTNNGDEIKVSTRFFGTLFNGQQCFWETVVFVNGSLALEKRHERYQDAQEGHQHARDQYREIIYPQQVETPENVVLDALDYDNLALMINEKLLGYMWDQEQGNDPHLDAVKYWEGLSKKLIPLMRHKVELRIAHE